MWFSNRSDTNRAVLTEEIGRDGNFEFRKYRNCTIRVAKTETLISFAYAKCWFSHDTAHLIHCIICPCVHVQNIRTICFGAYLLMT